MTRGRLAPGRARARGTRRGPLAPQVKGWLTWKGDFLLGPRYVRLLEGIEELGTIRAAASRVGLSYRTCLTRIRRVEDTRGQTIVETARGGAARGGARLTAPGRELVRVYHAWRAALAAASDAAFARAVGDRATRGPSRRR